MLKNKHTLPFIILFTIFFIYYFFLAFVALDSDFGWHVRLGEIILGSGIPHTDPLSYTMPSYPFVDHEWLSNVLIASVLPKIGMVGLSLFFSLLGISLLFLTVFILKKEQREFALIPLLFAFTTNAAFFGVRTQVSTWFFLSILLIILLRFKRFIWFVPILVLLWANLHGGFAVSIPILTIYCFTQWWKKKKFPLLPVTITLISFAVTFINPYEWRIWWEEWMQFSDTGLHWHINEWQPAFFFFNLFSMWIFMGISLVIVFLYRNKFSLFEKLLYLMLLFMGLSSVRHVSLWFLVSLPLTAKGFYYLRENAKRYHEGLKRFTIVYSFLCIASIIVIIFQLFLIIKNHMIFSLQAFYPVYAVEWLDQHPPQGNIFAPYEWGGYLDWKLPQKKIFIDGRMPSWRWQAPNSGESNNAFLEYRELGDGLPLKKEITKYNIAVFLLPISVVQEDKNKKNWISNLFAKNMLQQADFFPKQLFQYGFKKVYQDSIAVIFEKL